MIFIVSGCVSDVSQGGRVDAIPKGSSSTGNPAGSTSSGVGGGEVLPPKIEIRHLIEPNLSTDTNYSTGTGAAGGGSYVRKLTLPKNFAGRLYVAGINVGTLQSTLVRVRFKFGVGLEPVTIPATVARAAGITPQTDISVLVLDLRSEPFRNIRLPYDLYDYNDYDASTTPVQDNRDSGLYCRGLRLEHDPTFEGVGPCDGSPQPEQCLYSYAKVMDQGLLKLSGTSRIPITPSLAQAKTLVSSIYSQDRVSEMLKKALPDANPGASFTFSNIAVGVSGTEDIVFGPPSTAHLFSPKVFGIDGATYYYRGPYRLINNSEWQYKNTDLTSDKGLFRSRLYYDYGAYGAMPDYPTQDYIYFGSYMFPLATKVSLGAGVPHLSSNTVFGARVDTTLSAAGSTAWMDGSNARVQSKNSDLEHIGSCNVSSTIEILAQDSNKQDYIVASAHDVKLQLVRPTQYRTDTGDEVLFSNFKTCSTNASCGGSECCLNNRCWDESLVSQCIDESSYQGNGAVGTLCDSDFDCSSLCCNTSSSQCAPHNPTLNPAVLCMKPVHQFCIAKEWCAKYPVDVCLIVKTGTDPLGNVTCRQQCFRRNEFGECKNSQCEAPTQPTYEPFDPNAAGACDNAVPAPSF